MSTSQESRQADAEPIRRSLFDGFEGYRTPTSEDYARLLSTGLVVPDANVLLNLYRYDDAARDALIRVLEALGDRLWVPHQVLTEFWRNRESVLRDPRDTNKAIAELEGHRAKVIQMFRAWANRVSLEADSVADLTAKLEQSFSAVADAIHERDLEDATLYARDTASDPVLQVLEPVLEGRCGGPLSDEAQERAIAEGMRRVDCRLPPGYMDKKKGDRDAAGDYLVWEQVLTEAASRRVDVLLITGDVKEDWWREEGGERRGPRLELVEELRVRAGVRLFMLRPTSLLGQARSLLGVDVRPESVQDVERVEQFLAHESAPKGWTAEAAQLLLSRLDSQAPVQAAAIRLAARQGGRVDREQIYELGSYGDERSLRGFRRPVTRLVEELRATGAVDEAAPDVLWVEYDGGVSAKSFNLEPSFMLCVDPAIDERRILRFLVSKFETNPDSRISLQEIEVGTGVPMPLLGQVLLSLSAQRYIKTISNGDDTCPEIVTAVSEAGYTFLGWIRSVPVTREDGTTTLMSMELDGKLANLLRQGFQLGEVKLSDDGNINISVEGTVTEDNIDLLRSLGGSGKPPASG